MARLRRLKIKGSDAYYHVMSRTVGQQFLLRDNEKDKFVEILNDLSNLFFVKVIGFSVMSNHFHLLIKMESVEHFDNEIIIDRIRGYYHREFILSNSEICKFKEKLGDISEYMKLLKQKFALWYNRQNNRKGHFWSDRFKSVLIENGESLLNCLAYIDLNAVRADITIVPEEYRWSSIACRINNCDQRSFLSMEGIIDITKTNSIKGYLDYLYFTGNIENHGANNRIIKKKINSYSIQPGIYRSKTNIFSDSMVLGSHHFVQNSYDKFGKTILTKKNKNIYKTEFSNKIFSVRRKYEKKIH
ncbi:MAG: transposase [Candidatus Aminicenantes bacterium]|nr:transposase [Candidatus Aminicenantes bacterium]